MRRLRAFFGVRIPGRLGKRSRATTAGRERVTMMPLTDHPPLSRQEERELAILTLSVMVTALEVAVGIAVAAAMLWT